MASVLYCVILISIKRAGISEKELEIYAEMERNFQKYMEGGHVPLREMYDEVFHLAR